MNCPFIEFKAFSMSIFEVTFSMGWGLFIKPRKTCVANSAPFWYLHLLVDFHILRDSKTWCRIYFADNRRKVLPTAIGRSPPLSFFSAFSFGTKEVRPKFERYFSLESHIHKICKGTEKKPVQFARST